MSECPNCGNLIEDDKINICPHCNFSFEYDSDEISKRNWYFLACIIIILIIATPFLTIFFLFP